MNLVVAGRSFLLRDRRMGEHLYFVLTDPDPVTDYVVVVALVSEKNHTDKTVTLNVGDHPFIRWASNIDYGTATYMLAKKIDAALANGRAALDADMSDDLLKRARAGLMTSGHTANDIRHHCEDRFPKPE
jgi:hypothetical protein